MRKRKRKTKCILIIIALLVIAAVVLVFLFTAGTVVPAIKSPVDFNGNGLDDYADFVLGARADAKNLPHYDGSFYTAGGYPPDGIGVCTDTVWRAFKAAGYSLKDMVDRDIKENTGLYPRVGGKPDPNIDFRRVKNLVIFFERYAVSLPVGKNDLSIWKPGDIVIYENCSHIGIVSDKGNIGGRPLLIHNAGNFNLFGKENDQLFYTGIIGHYRFDASLLSDDKLIAWT